MLLSDDLPSATDDQFDFLLEYFNLEDEQRPADVPRLEVYPLSEFSKASRPERSTKAHLYFCRTYC